MNAACLLFAALPALSIHDGPAHAQATAPFARPDVQASFDAWRAPLGPGWTMFAEPSSGYASFVGGGRLATGAAPRDDAEWFERARALAAATAAMTGVEPETLVDGRVHLVPLALVGGQDKWSVQLAQAVAGVPVLDGWWNALFDLDGNALALQSTCVTGASVVATKPVLGADEASSIARAAFERDTGLPGTPTGAAELAIVAGPRLVWIVDVQWQAHDAVPEGFTYRIDAASGALVARQASIHQLDVGGTVSLNATPGTKPDGPGNPPQAFPAAHVRVSSSAGTTFTNSSGAFNYPGVSGPLLCTFTYEGPFAVVQNAAGANDSVQVALSGTGNAVLMNPTPIEFTTAQANAARTISRQRDWIRAADPADATADFELLANVNLAGTCSAYFNGSSINFFRASGTCPNTAYSTIISHEAGHWLNVLYGSGNGSLGMGEGNADACATYVHDTPIVGEDLCGPGCHVRSGLNLRQFCGDCCEGCHGSAHADGEVWMGASWKVRARLNQSLGDALGDEVANALFVGWLNAFDQTGIQSVIETQWLTLDDVDGNIDNGTPHFDAIDGGFREQGFPGHTPTSFGTSLCFGDGAGTPCPCGNSGGAGAGCAHGSGGGATLTASASAGGTLSVTHAVPGQPGLFFQGDNALNGGAGFVFGDGLRCCGANLVRLDVVVADGAGSASFANAQSSGGASSGDMRCYQFWYRDPATSPCGFAFNLSSAVSILWP